MTASTIIKSKKRQTTNVPECSSLTASIQNNTIYVSGVPSLNGNAMHRLTSKKWFGKFGKILHINIDDVKHCAIIRYSLHQAAESAINWSNGHSSHSKLRANFAAFDNMDSKAWSTEAQLYFEKKIKRQKEKYQLLQQKLSATSKDALKSKAVNKLLHQIIEKLRRNKRNKEEKENAFFALHQELESFRKEFNHKQQRFDELEKEQQMRLNLEIEQRALYDDNQCLKRDIKSQQNENDRLTEINIILGMDKDILMEQKVDLEQNYQILWKERGQCIEKWHLYKEQYYVIVDQYESLKKEYNNYRYNDSRLYNNNNNKYKYKRDGEDVFDWSEVYDWIVNVRGGEFIKYIHPLSVALKHGNLGFSDLFEMNEKDLMMIGVSETKDVMLLFNEIQTLRASKLRERGYDKCIDAEGEPSTYDSVPLRDMCLI